MLRKKGNVTLHRQRMCLTILYQICSLRPMANDIDQKHSIFGMPSPHYPHDNPFVSALNLKVLRNIILTIIRSVITAPSENILVINY